MGKATDADGFKVVQFQARRKQDSQNK